jgi:hypothetical protein
MLLLSVDRGPYTIKYTKNNTKYEKKERKKKITKYNMKTIHTSFILTTEEKKTFFHRV